jgi:hypothetical protein
MNLDLRATVRVTDDIAATGLSAVLAITPTGARYFVGVQNVSTSPETLLIGDCASLRNVLIATPSTGGQTLTVTAAPIVIKPGDFACFPPSTTLVTLAATGSLNVSACGCEA